VSVRSLSRCSSIADTILDVSDGLSQNSASVTVAMYGTVDSCDLVPKECCVVEVEGKGVVSCFENRESDATSLLGGV